MKLLDDMKKADQSNYSVFTLQLLKEDIARLEQLCVLRKTHSDLKTFKVAAMALGWTQGNARNLELDPELSAFLDEAFKGNDNFAILETWHGLDQRRMDLLVGCLSRPRLD